MESNPDVPEAYKKMHHKSANSKSTSSSTTNTPGTDSDVPSSDDSNSDCEELDNRPTINTKQNLTTADFEESNGNIRCSDFISIPTLPGAGSIDMV